jgi:hypothetical protein
MPGVGGPIRGGGGGGTEGAGGGAGAVGPAPDSSVLPHDVQ